MSTNKTEIYVRFQSADYGSGMFEAACHSIEEAAGQFAEDSDSVSACALEIDTSGRLVSAREIARVARLRSLWCPHGAFARRTNTSCLVGQVALFTSTPTISVLLYLSK